MNDNRKRHPGNYKKLAKLLKEHGYEVEKEITYEYRNLLKSLEQNTKRIAFVYWKITGKNIYAGFCTPNRHSYGYLSGYIVADNIECFDKWRKCPLMMKIQNIDYEKLIQQLSLLGSPEGFEISNNFDENEIFTNEFPYDYHGSNKTRKEEKRYLRKQEKLEKNNQ